MRQQASPGRAFLLGAALTLVCVGNAMADDTEIFMSTQGGASPNIVLILDTSGSMNSAVVTQPPYDPATTYPGTCDASRVYWRQDTGTPPNCGTSNWFNSSAMTCNAALVAMASTGNYLASRGAQWSATNNRWEQLRAVIKDQYVECRADAGLHGQTTGDPQVFAWNSGVANQRWTDNSGDQIGWNSNGADRTYTFYSANYLNWYYDTTNLVTQSRLEVVQEVATNLVNSISGVNIGLMRYSNNGGSGDASAQGGMVTYPVSPVESARAQLAQSINDNTAAGNTPLSETMYEAEQYYAGRAVDYGNNSMVRPGDPLPSVPASRKPNDPDQYQSPLEASCQKSYIVYLTDGEPTADTDADDKIIALPDFSTLVSPDCDDVGDGRCLDDLAEYMFKADMRPDVPGDQHVITYTIGFGPDVAGSTFLQKVAQRGGGEAFSAADSATLTTALSNIVTQIFAASTTFVAPSVPVNAFNRTETLSDLYIPVFKPATTFHWPGNVKKYRLENGEIVDADGNPAIDPATGFFADGARSIWSSSTDGAEVTLGGAASRLPVPSNRKVYTFLGDSDLTATTNRVSSGNALLTDAVLGVGLPDQPTRTQLLDWTVGFDVQDVDGDGDTNEGRAEIGDPIHGHPAVVVYGGTAATPNIDDAVVFAPTNDGYLHAIDARTGQEMWSFIPAELLDSLVSLYQNQPEAQKHYGLDGDVRAFKLDNNQNGIVEPTDGDRVLLFFGMRSGGSNYYALDVTSRTSPQHLWTLRPADLPGLGLTWSTPSLTRVDIRGASQNNLKLALVFGGGYDLTQDNDQGTTFYNTDATGNRIFMVDALSGSLLWYAGGAGAGTPNLVLPKMNNSIPSIVRVLDLDGDGFGDRMYVGDMGGRLWRFDIIIDTDMTAAGLQPPDADGLVTGGVIAALGNADDGTHPLASTRHFYQAPDVSLVRRRGANAYLNVALGSGWRGHPLNTDIQDRFYSIRDYRPFDKMTQAEYDALTPVVDSDLADITTNVSPVVPVGSPGWKLELRLPGGFEGEKVLAESRTFNNIIFFPTYLPLGTAGADPCAPGGTNRAYAVSVDDGRPVIDINRDGQTTLEDRYTRLAQGGIAPEFSFLFPARDQNGGSGGNGNGLGGGGRPLLCTVGVEVMPGMCANAGAPVRTYWRQTGTR